MSDEYELIVERSLRAGSECELEMARDEIHELKEKLKASEAEKDLLLEDIQGLKDACKRWEAENSDKDLEIAALKDLVAQTSRESFESGESKGRAEGMEQLYNAASARAIANGFVFDKPCLSIKVLCEILKSLADYEKERGEG